MDLIDEDFKENNLYRQRTSLNSDRNSTKVPIDELRNKLRRKTALLTLKVGGVNNKPMKFGDDEENLLGMIEGKGGEYSSLGGGGGASLPMEFSTNATSFIKRPSGSHKRRKQNKFITANIENTDF